MSNLVLFENAPKGGNKIAEMLPTLTEILGQPRLTNHSIRAQTIQTLIRLGYTEHEVTQFTGKFRYSGYIRWQMLITEY